VALSGAIGEAFDQANLAFSLNSGRFETRGISRGTVFIDADGPVAVWLGRAVKRMDFGVSDSRTEGDVVIRHSKEGYEVDGETYLTIQSLSKALIHQLG